MEFGRVVIVEFFKVGGPDPGSVAGHSLWQRGPEGHPPAVSVLRWCEGGHHERSFPLRVGITLSSGC